MTDEDLKRMDLDFTLTPDAEPSHIVDLDAAIASGIGKGILVGGPSKASTMAAAELRKRFLETWPAMAQYFERMKAEGKSVVWSASQAAKPPRALTIEELQRSHDFAAKQCEGRTLRESPFKVPDFIDIEPSKETP